MPAQAIQIAESRPGFETANYNQLAAWEGPRALICRNDVDNVAYDRHAKVTNRADFNESAKGISNYVFADGHAKGMTFGGTWGRIGPDVTSGSNPVTPTVWRQNFGGWNDVCKYVCKYVAP